MELLMEHPMAKTIKPNDILDALEHLTLEELNDIANAASSLRHERKEAEVQRLREEFTAKIKALGHDPETFLRGAVKTKSGKGVSTLPPKYIGPNKEEYSGKGRMAGWLQELVDAGKNADDYINPEWRRAKGLVD